MTANSQNLAVVILAAGKGTRMRSDLPKVLHQLRGKPLLSHVISQARFLGASKVVVVVGHQADRVKDAFTAQPGLSFALQEPQLGTGHAVMAAAKALKGHDGPVLILSGDVPALRGRTLQGLLSMHNDNHNALTVLGMELDDPGHYGRLITDSSGGLGAIREFRDATEAEKAVRLVNAGIYVADSKRLLEYLPRLEAENDQKEYYLTDLVELMAGAGLKVGFALCPDPREVGGINSKDELARMEAYLASRED